MLASAVAEYFMAFHKERRTPPAQLEQAYDRISERRHNRVLEIMELNELLDAPPAWVDVEATQSLIMLLHGWNDDDECRLEAIDELLGR